MSAAELLVRLSVLASTDAGDFLDFNHPDAKPGEPPRVDLHRARRRGKLACIRRLRETTRTTLGRGDEPPTVERTLEIEFHDATKPLALLAKLHGLIRDRPPAGAGGPADARSDREWQAWRVEQDRLLMDPAYCEKLADLDERTMMRPSDFDQAAAELAEWRRAMADRAAANRASLPPGPHRGPAPLPSPED